MSKTKIKNSAEDFERLQIRDEFAKSYKKLNSLAGSNTASCYAAFKLAFYSCKDGKELLKKKGLRIYTATGKIRPLNVYLDYATKEELIALNDGLNEIRKMMVLSSSNFPGYPFMIEEITKIGIQARYKFAKEFNEFPEYYALTKRSVASIKRATIDKEELARRYDELKNAQIIIEKQEEPKKDDKPSYDELVAMLEELKKKEQAYTEMYDKLHEENAVLRQTIERNAKDKNESEHDGK